MLRYRDGSLQRRDEIRLKNTREVVGDQIHPNILEPGPAVGGRLRRYCLFLISVGAMQAAVKRSVTTLSLRIPTGRAGNSD